MGLNMTMRQRALLKITKVVGGVRVFQWINPDELDEKKADGWEQAEKAEG
jgi:hypothetical protein